MLLKGYFGARWRACALRACVRSSKIFSLNPNAFYSKLRKHLAMPVKDFDEVQDEMEAGLMEAMDDSFMFLITPRIL